MRMVDISQCGHLDFLSCPTHTLLEASASQHGENAILSLCCVLIACVVLKHQSEDPRTQVVITADIRGDCASEMML
jgi:hypothetical protein